MTSHLSDRMRQTSLLQNLAERLCHVLAVHHENENRQCKTGSDSSMSFLLPTVPDRPSSWSRKITRTCRRLGVGQLLTYNGNGDDGGTPGAAADVNQSRRAQQSPDDFVHVARSLTVGRQQHNNKKRRRHCHNLSQIRQSHRCDVRRRHNIANPRYQLYCHGMC